MRPPAELSLIIGGDGFFGRNLRIYFENRGWPTHVIGRSDGDLTDLATVERLFHAAPRVGCIFHVVTRQRTGKVQYEIQADLLASNLRIHLNVLESWRRHQAQAKLVSIGSSCAYPELHGPIPETALLTGKLHPSVRGYGLAKVVLAEGSELFAQQYGLRYLHCVAATMYGPYDHKAPDRSHFMGALIDRAVREKSLGGARLEVWGNAETTRDLLYVDDQIEAVLAANAIFSNTVINVGANDPVTIGRVARAVVQALCWDAEIIYPEGMFVGAAFKSIDSSRFLEATGWRPQVDLVTGIRTVLAAEYNVEAAVQSGD